MLRPILPNPLMATRGFMGEGVRSFLEFTGSVVFIF